MESYFAMGGYAGFVWPAYALTACVLAGLVVASVRKLKALERDLAALEGEGQ